MADTRRVLDKINAARVAAGFGPIDRIARGTAASAGSCPVANSLKDAFPDIRVTAYAVSGFPTERAWAIAQAIGGEVANHNGTATIVTPLHLRNFIQEFDNGLLPEYRG